MLIMAVHHEALVWGRHRLPSAVLSQVPSAHVTEKCFWSDTHTLTPWKPRQLGGGRDGGKSTESAAPERRRRPFLPSTGAMASAVSRVLCHLTRRSGQRFAASGLGLQGRLPAGPSLPVWEN